MTPLTATCIAAAAVALFCCYERIRFLLAKRRYARRRRELVKQREQRKRAVRAVHAYSRGRYAAICVHGDQCWMVRFTPATAVAATWELDRLSASSDSEVSVLDAAILSAQIREVMQEAKYS